MVFSIEIHYGLLLKEHLQMMQEILSLKCDWLKHHSTRSSKSCDSIEVSLLLLTEETEIVNPKHFY